MPDRIDELIKSHNEMKVEFARLSSALGERCPEHERRLVRLENGSSRAIRIWGALIAIIATVFGIIVLGVTIWRGT